MKKITTLLLFILSITGITAFAQNTNCNAEFNISYQSGNTLLFVPIALGNAATTQHYWNFGDGGTSNTASPVHTYLSGSIFNVRHVLVLHDSTGAIACIDSAYRVIQVQSACNLSASFLPTIISTAPVTFHFQNTSTAFISIDSAYWTFGDGSQSNDMSPSHTYTQPGMYIVCLRVQHFTSAGTTPCVSETCDTVVVPNTGCTLVANFTATNTTATNTYYFQNISSPVNANDSIRWTFGDGSSSNQFSPNHTYTQPGNYSVCLRVQKRNSLGLTSCIREICYSIVIQNPNPCTLVASFYSVRDTTAASSLSNLYHFINTSTPLNTTDSIRWIFGDGSSSNLANPTHAYGQAGTYTVCLRVQKRNLNGTLTNCISETCHVLVVVETCTLSANFYSYIDTTSSTINTYQFVNTSAPLNAYDSVHWSFGDGTSSTQFNPTHTYAQPGTYTVCLRVQKRGLNGVGLTNCISEICHTVIVNAVCNIQAHFSWHADSVNHNIVYFSNQTISSTAGAIANWTFGDGSSSTVWDPVHQYAQAGNYLVCLRVQLSVNCVSYSCDTIIIQQPLPGCVQQSDFTFVRLPNNSQSFNFTPTYLNSNWQYTWTFGDGTGSHNTIASHHYPQPGNYTACLTVYRDSTCASTTCSPLMALHQANCDSVHVAYTYYRDSLMPNRIYFHTTSNYSITSERWTITRLPASSGTAPVVLTQYNPAYLFQVTGYYRVCLRAVTSGGCVKEYCQVIHITQVITTNTCNLQLYPNPANNVIAANIFLNQSQMIDIYIYNTLNVLVAQKHQQGHTGNNLVVVPIANLVAGAYTMKVIHGNSICYAQFVKL